MNNSQIKNDDIDIKELILSIWHGKIYIFSSSLLFVFFATIYLHIAEKKYLVEYKVKPVYENQQMNAFSGLSGLASISGIQLPSNASGDFKIFKELTTSIEVSEVIFRNKEIVKKIYDDEWNSSLNIFSESKNKFMRYASVVINFVYGNYEINYIPPNARRLAIYISENIEIHEDKDTGFLTLKAKTSKPNMHLKLIDEIVEISDQIMRQRYIDFSKEPLAFYKDKLRTARSREHREVLAELISKEEQKLMFASKGKYFTAEPYIEPTISLHPVAPKPVLILIFALFLGSFIGYITMLLRNSNMEVKK